MHEMSIALAVIDRAETAARCHGAESVEAVRVVVGEVSGVVPEALRFAFEVAREGTALHGARLVIDTAEGSARCGPCDTTFALGMPPQLWCPHCDGSQVEVLTGRELEVTSVDLPDDHPEGVSQ
ncbi:hydrogenase maturation nickel metallochaperone HypA [Streptomyces sp. NPDC005438]|uniref:hydrogenase maturation nickel metallochaperone HypA n=1 Tax=Streptomyces sp. NPDC005438 TaxID=3156880 RepID=UPI0033BBCF84